MTLTERPWCVWVSEQAPATRNDQRLQVGRAWVVGCDRAKPLGGREVRFRREWLRFMPSERSFVPTGRLEGAAAAITAAKNR